MQVAVWHQLLTWWQPSCTVYGRQSTESIPHQQHPNQMDGRKTYHSLQHQLTCGQHMVWNDVVMMHAADNMTSASDVACATLQHAECQHD